GTFFTTGLKYRMSDEKIKLLQEFLNTDPDTEVTDSGAGSSGNETNYFGELTLRAVERFQVKHSIATKNDLGYGSVGPKTRAKLNDLLGTQ
ncbi:MAG: peptidoglycan-binding protein, partial [Candidatus Pacebacteria bacterium]|nr:peptidoglycan-binding protein [Candidatus Paceibacterota bacterium]